MNDKYLQYQIEDFLTDDAFVNWTLDGQNDDAWSLWLQEHPDAKTSIQEAQSFVRNIKFSQKADASTIARSKSQVWDKIEKSTQAKEVLMQSSSRRYVISLLAAASVALLCFFLFPSQDNFIENKGTDVLVAALPAESNIGLSPTSSIEYDKDNWKKQRNVSLKGNATFDVTKGVPFIVTGSNGKVEVLGTQFEVLDTENVFQVKVSEGKVRTTSGNIKEILTKDMSFFKNPVWNKDQTLDEKWMSGTMFFAFDNQNLSSVINALALSKKMNFSTDAIDTNKRYTGYFNSSETLETLLQKVFWPMNYVFEIEDNIVTIGVKKNE